MAAVEAWRCCILVTQTISIHEGQLLCFTLQLCTEWIKIFMHSCAADAGSSRTCPQTKF